MRTTLTLDIDYDPTMTDPEGLACAMDRLMATICSTPGILDEYGNPTIGEFFVEQAADEPSRYVLYDFDADDLAATTVYDDPREAAEDASQLDNVIVVALPIPFSNTEEEPE